MNKVKIGMLELMDELIADSELTEEDVEALAQKINEGERSRLEKELE